MTQDGVNPDRVLQDRFGAHPISVDCLSKPAAANAALNKVLQERDDLLESIPSVPAILHSLLAELGLPAEEVNLLRVADLIGRDKSLAAQCLRMANSPLFGRGIPTDSLRGAVRTLGISHIRDLAVTGTLRRIATAQNGLDPMVFWQHSLGCAIVSRKLARSVGFGDPEKAYLAGLMHDLGYVVNLVLLPEQTRAALENGQQTHRFMGEWEYSALGFTHCQSGEVLARKWRFSDDLVEVILCHHNPIAATVNPGLVAIVALADRLCRSANLGIGYKESPDPASCWQSDWAVLQSHIPQAARMQWSDFADDADEYFSEIREMVFAIFQVKA
jgi:putative nucleotidyltransferase with HDIG domain